MAYLRASSRLLGRAASARHPPAHLQRPWHPGPSAPSWWVAVGRRPGAVRRCPALSGEASPRAHRNSSWGFCWITLLSLPLPVGQRNCVQAVWPSTSEARRPCTRSRGRSERTAAERPPASASVPARSRKPDSCTQTGTGFGIVPVPTATRPRSCWCRMVQRHHHVTALHAGAAHLDQDASQVGTRADRTFLTYGEQRSGSSRDGRSRPPTLHWSHAALAVLGRAGHPSQARASLAS